jgi:carboxymethylenebutenolidase
MCDNKTIQDMEEHVRCHGDMSRREFGALSVGAGLSFLLPRAGNAQEITSATVEVETPDGTADGYFVHPITGTHPGILIWPDARGLRPAFQQMADRLAESGYAVLVVNQYYRSKPAPVLPEGAQFADPDTQKTLRAMMGSLNAGTHVVDARALIGWLGEQDAVDNSRKMGTAGYCMGGPMTMRTAAALPERIGAAASFHGGGLVTDQPDSPHLLVPQMQARYLFAIAANDDESQPEAKDVLRDAFAQAGLPAEIEVYEGALHGWCPPDSSVYNEAQAERAWSRLLVLFEEALA